MKLLAALLFGSLVFAVGYVAGRGFNRMDLESFDAQAQIIAELCKERDDGT